MIREVCLFDKFSFCKNGVKCMRIHLKEVCQVRECDYRKCNKRHPKPCRIFRMNGFCRFGTSCGYSHRLPKEVEEQNEKIKSIEKVNLLLSKQVEDQSNEIKELKIRLIDIESRALKSLQKQVDDLAKYNSEKETAIQNMKLKYGKLVEKVVEINNETELEKSSMIADDVTLEETNITEEKVSESEERCEAETIKKATIKYAHKCLAQVDKLEAEIRKIRKNTANLGSTLTTKCNNFFVKLDEIEVKEELCEDVIERIVQLRQYLSFSEKNPDKERNLKSVLNCKKYLKGYLKYPKRPSQIPLNNCCKICLMSSNVLTF